MSIEFDLSFDGKSAAQRLQETCTEVVDDLCASLMEYAASILAGHDYAEVEMSLRTRLSSLVKTGLIEGDISSDHWKSFLAEFGSGSLMDTSNDALYLYMASEFWNPDRTSLAISGRAYDPYTGLDGQEHDKHTGALAGVNLEELSKNDPHFQDWMASVGLPPDAFQPKPPLHFLRATMLDNKEFIIDQIQGAIETFNFGSFFI